MEERPGNAKRRAQAAEERPSKRRRLGQASVLCMRELFRAVVRDGDITAEDRVVLQNVALLLSQVEGQTWVNFADSGGELRDFTPQELKKLKPFLEKVANELREHETRLESPDASGKTVAFDCLQLADVPWAHGVTARELLGCCCPDEELQLESRWLGQIFKRLPSKYMLRSRAVDLVNYYHLRHQSSRAARPRRPVPAGRRCCSCLAPRLAAFGAALQPCLQRCRRAGAKVAVVPRTASSAVARAVVDVARLAVAAGSALWAARPRLQRQQQGRQASAMEPLWATVRFFCAAFLHSQSREVFKFVVMITRLRVFVCLGTCNWLFGWILYPLVFVVEKVLKLSRGNPLLGCSCHQDESVSWFSYLPVRAAQGLVAILQSVRFLPGCELLAEPIVHITETISPVLAFIFDLVFSIGVAQGLAMVVDLADEQAQQKLVFMSMGLSRMMREDGALPVLSGAEGQQPLAPEPSASASGTATTAQQTAAPYSGQAEPVPPGTEDAVPVWSDDGSWSIYD